MSDSKSSVAFSGISSPRGDSHPTAVAGERISTAVVKRFSRDEMNLAEFPLAVLSTRHDSDVKTLEFSDSLTGKNGERIERKWVITGADKFGLPTASDDEVLLGLLRLSASQEFRDRRVTFTRYELLRILKWSTEGRSYGRLQRALDRLSGVRIKTSNGFFDNSSKSHQTRNFGIIDAYELNDGRGDREIEAGEEISKKGKNIPGANRRGYSDAVKPSFFIWSEVMFTSFQSGFIKKLDLDFLLGLKSAVSKRLYRFLDKHFWYRSKVHYNLFTLAHEKIGISRNYSYASQLKQQLEPAIDELIAQGFLQGCEYSGKGSDTEIVLIAGIGNRAAANSAGNSIANLATNSATNSTMNFSGNFSGNFPGNSSGKFSGSGDKDATTSLAPIAETFDGKSGGAGEIVSALEQRGLAKAQAFRVVGNLDAKQLLRAKLVIQHFDQLIASDSNRVNKNPAGFLYRAIERVENFVLPGEKRDTAFAKPASRLKATRESQAQLQNSLASQVALDSRSAALLKSQRASLKLQVEPQLVDKIRAEVTKSLEKLRGIISEARFQDTIEHAVEERIAKLLG